MISIGIIALEIPNVFSQAKDQVVTCSGMNIFFLT